MSPERRRILEIVKSGLSNKPFLKNERFTILIPSGMLKTNELIDLSDDLREFDLFLCSVLKEKHYLYAVEVA